MAFINNIPPQLLSFSAKTKKWRKQHLDWADNLFLTNSSHIRETMRNKLVNRDLINGIIHMDDITNIINPYNQEDIILPELIQHYPIINSKLNVLRGEEIKRPFTYRVTITNPNALSQIYQDKTIAIQLALLQLIQDSSLDDLLFQANIQKMADYFTYDYRDMREVRANRLLNHYVKELDLKIIFNQGFMDAMTVGEEIYMCNIVSGEPVVEKLDPLNVIAYSLGYSRKFEDADIVIIKEYWSIGKIIDTYYDSFSPNDIKKLEEIGFNGGETVDSLGNIDETKNFVLGTLAEPIFNTLGLFAGSTASEYTDYDGNIRVLRMFWKSRRKIKKVKSYDPISGEEIYDFYPEDYVVDFNAGEEEETLWINQAWEGTKIGKDIYVNMRPRLVQYNRMSNPSRCHFGIIGSIYASNGDRPYSLVLMMKPYSYMYDVVHDKLNKLIADNYGKLLIMDFASVPKGWTTLKWLYFAKANKILVKDSFKEGNVGASMGKLAGALNNNNVGVVDAELGNSIQMHINILEYLKQEVGEVSGMSRQREGLISNRETVGGVERATLQSSHITEYLFFEHENVKKRVLEGLLETAKVALRGKSKKFNYILSDGSLLLCEIDGDEFAECDYGLMVDNSEDTLKLEAKMESLSQAALQNSSLRFSTVLKLFNSTSIREKQRMIEKEENENMQKAQENSQMQQQAALAQAQQEMQLKMLELELKELANIRDNETKILVANIAKENDGIVPEGSADELYEKIRLFDEKMNLERNKLDFNRSKAELDNAIRKQQIEATRYNRK